MERALERRPRLGERLFTESEREYAAARARPAQHLAARFCAKEAVAKSLGLGGWSFSDVEVVPGAPPAVRLHGRAEQRAASSVCRCTSRSRTTAARPRRSPAPSARSGSRARASGPWL